jgi:hypothetical protein
VTDPIPEAFKSWWQKHPIGRVHLENLEEVIEDAFRAGWDAHILSLFPRGLKIERTPAQVAAEVQKIVNEFIRPHFPEVKE